MFCKYEGGQYIPYDTVVSAGRLADVVDIKFEELDTERDCLAALQNAQWALMSSLKKMVIHDCIVPKYAFPGGALTNLKEIEVSESIINMETTKSLLTAAPKIKKFSTDKNIFPVVKNNSFEERLRLELEIEILMIQLSERTASWDSLDIKAERRSTPLQAMKGGDPSSGQTLVPHVEDGVQPLSDEDEDEDESSINTLFGYVSRQGFISNKIADDYSLDIKLVGDDDDSVDSNESVSTLSVSDEGDRESTDSDDMEEFLHSSTILCYFRDVSQPIPYSEITPRDLGKIIRVTYDGLGHADDAMTKLPWAQLTGLQSLDIRNALVASDAPFQSQDKKILFPNLVKMTFSKCKLASKALGGFVARASDNLTTLAMSDCDISYGSELQAIAKLKSKVDNRSQSVSENSNRRDNVGADASVGLENDRRGFKGGHNSNGNPARTTKHPTPCLQRNHSGQVGNLSSRQSQTFGADLSGSRIPGGPGRQSVFSSIPVDRGGTHRKMGSVRDGFSTEFLSMDTNSGHVDHFKGRISRSEMVVENEAAIRDYEKLCIDTAVALGMIKAAVTVGKEKYSSVEIDGVEATRIVYQGTSNTIPILDASIDTVKVHRGWREVDNNTSIKDRALIIIKYLGIPPCPPDIHISKDSTPLGKAIRAEFTRLQHDESEIIVSRIKNSH